MVDRTREVSLPVAVIGAGPIGLAAAAQLADRRLPFVVLESAEETGSSVRQWSHVRLFSPWRYNIDAAARRLLDAAGWSPPDLDWLPTGGELVESYLRPLAELPALAPHIRYRSQVTGIGRVGIDRVRSAGRQDVPFVVRLAGGEEVHARAVIDASGTWSTPNVVGANGLPAIGETEAATWMDQALPDVLGGDRERYARRHTVVVGAGHSAITTLLALSELVRQVPGTRVTWAIRSADPERAYGGGTDDLLPARGALGAQLRPLVDSGVVELASDFCVSAIHPLADAPSHGGVKLAAHAADGSARVLVADRIVAATGYRSDHRIAAELRLDLDPILGSTRALGPLIDPNEHDCCSVHPHGLDALAQPEPDFWVVGVKSYGRAPGFLMAIGYEQVRSVSAALAGDWQAAQEIQLDLPDVGVCSTTLSQPDLTVTSAA